MSIPAAFVLIGLSRLRDRPAFPPCALDIFASCVLDIPRRGAVQLGRFPKRDRSKASPISSPQPPPGHVFFRAHEHQKADGRSSRLTQSTKTKVSRRAGGSLRVPDPFFKISFSSRSTRFSRRSRLSSSRSSVVSPSLRLPSSRSACRTQFQIECADGSNCRDNSAGVRPDRTSSTILRRNSAGYGERLFAIVNSSLRRAYSPKRSGVHETGATPLLCEPSDTRRLAAQV